MKRDSREGVKRNACSACGYLMGAATCMEEGELETSPSEGDKSICINCGNIMLFRADGTLRRLTDDEWRNMPDERVNFIARLENLRTKMNLERRKRFRL